MAKVAFLGLGVMGYPMARHLKDKGHEVTVYNRTVAKAEQWVSDNGGRAVATPREAAAGQEIVFACVGNDDDLRDVTIGPAGRLPCHGKGRDLSSITPRPRRKSARELAAAADIAGFGFIDAPVSGGQAGAENGVLTVMCGGEEKVYAAVEPAIMSFARSCRLLGPSGLGPARQDGQPGLHCGARAGPVRGDRPSARRPGST